MSTDINKYNIQFNTFKLTELNFTINKNYPTSEEHPAPIEITPEIGAGFAISGTKKCIVFLEVKITNSGAPFSFLIKGEAEFTFENEISEEKELTKLVHVNLLAIMYPFIREPIAEITRKMGFSPLLLPPLNFVEIFKNISQEQIKNKML